MPKGKAKDKLGNLFYAGGKVRCTIHNKFGTVVKIARADEGMPRKVWLRTPGGENIETYTTKVIKL